MMLNKIKSYFSNGSELAAEPDVWVIEPEEPPFVTFPCRCGHQVAIHTKITPGDAAVVDCPNCQISWTVFNPSLIISETKEINSDLQKAVWGELSQ